MALGPDAFSFPPQPATALLLPLLENPSAEVRRDTATGLGEFGAEAHATLTALPRLLSDPDVDVRNSAARAIAHISTTQSHRAAVAVMIVALQDSSPHARLDAARYLGTLGGDARDAIPALREASFDDSGDVRRAATEALTRIQSK